MIQMPHTPMSKKRQLGILSVGSLFLLLVTIYCMANGVFPGHADALAQGSVQIFDGERILSINNVIKAENADQGAATGNTGVTAYSFRVDVQGTSDVPVTF